MEAICAEWQSPNGIVADICLDRDKTFGENADALLSTLFGNGDDEEGGFGGILFELLVKNRSVPKKVLKAKLESMSHLVGELNETVVVTTPRTEQQTQLARIEEQKQREIAKIKADAPKKIDDLEAQLEKRGEEKVAEEEICWGRIGRISQASYAKTWQGTGKTSIHCHGERVHRKQEN